MSYKTIGIDVSDWQGRIDWEKVKPHVDFAVIRLGYGQNTLDSEARRNISECNRLGIPYGVYWFSYAYNVERAKNEARNALKRLEELGGKLDYPFWFDWEYDSRNHAAKLGYTISNQLLRDMATAFCTIIEEAGHYAGIYANYDYVHNHYGEKIFQRFDLWYAYLDTESDRAVNLHQFAWDYRVDGINANVDVNWCVADYPAIIAGMHTDNDIKKSVDELALEVLEDKHGRGEDRVKSLGDMYWPVQNRVNEILAERHEAEVTKVAWEVIRGDYDVDPVRSRLLIAKGYDPEEIQDRVNELLKIHYGG